MCVIFILFYDHLGLVNNHLFIFKEQILFYLFLEFFAFNNLIVCFYMFFVVVVQEDCDLFLGVDIDFMFISCSSLLDVPVFG